MPPRFGSRKQDPGSEFEDGQGGTRGLSAASNRGHKPRRRKNSEHSHEWLCHQVEGGSQNPQVQTPNLGHPAIDSFIFIAILAGNIILGHFVGVDFLPVGIPGVLHALHGVGLERVSFLEQLVHTLGIRSFEA